MEMKTCEEFIDIEFVSASSNFLCFYISSPPHSTDFEFHKLPASSHDSDSDPSPADELFYRGKLLPLHLPRRLQMVENLQVQNPSEDYKTAFEGQSNNPFIVISRKPPAANKSVLESSIISPSESRRVSMSTDLSSDDFSFGWSTEMRSFMNDHSEKSWFRNLKQSSFGQKLKTSRAFLKSLFGKSGCTDDSCAKTAHNNPQSNHVSHKNPRIRNGNCNVSAAMVKQNCKQMIEVNSQRRPFSGAVAVNSQRSSFSETSGTRKCCLSSSSSGSTSSSWSSSSNRLYDIQLLTRSSSFNLEIENPIEGAISHCKRSQDLS